MVFDDADYDQDLHAEPVWEFEGGAVYAERFMYATFIEYKKIIESKEGWKVLQKYVPEEFPDRRSHGGHFARVGVVVKDAP